MFRLLLNRSKALRALQRQSSNVGIAVTQLEVAVDEKSSEQKIAQIDFKTLEFESKVPATPYTSRTFSSHRTEIDQDTLKLLERLSLVNVDSKYVL